MARSKRGKVTGLGGVFFRTRDPAATGRWYAEHLGLQIHDWGGAAFPWIEPEAPHRTGYSVWSPFPADTEYFGTGGQAFMVNFRVHDLDALRAQLAAAGVEVDPRVEEGEMGRFGWCLDPEGNRIELWEPPAPAQKPRRAAAPARRKAPAKKTAVRKAPAKKGATRRR